jgi:dTDP-4-amino-4,6-dideoxygalactose transaminase
MCGAMMRVALGEKQVAECVPFVRPDVPKFDELELAFRAVFASGLFTKGDQLKAFEAEAASALETRDAIGVSSCTLGLALVLQAIVDRDDALRFRNEVIIPSFTFLASPAAAVWAGLRPVFVDIDPETWTVSLEAVEAAICPQTRAILACHTFGNPSDEAGLEAIAHRHGIDLVVDAAHGFGTSVDGRPVGRRGTAQVFSLSPTKLVVAGEGGVVATDDRDLACRVRVAREYGNDGAYGCTHAGLNARLSEIASAMARVSLARLPEVRQRRAEAAEAYAKTLSGLRGISLQRIPVNGLTSWKDFAIRVSAEAFGSSRDELRAFLAERGIDTRAYFDPPCHEMVAYQECRRVGTLCETGRLSRECVALPMGRHVTPMAASRIAVLIAEAAR